MNGGAKRLKHFLLRLFSQQTSNNYISTVSIAKSVLKIQVMLQLVANPTMLRFSKTTKKTKNSEQVRFNSFHKINLIQTKSKVLI